MGSVLIFPTVLEKHSAIAGPKISNEPTADIFFEYLSASFAHLTQICISGKNAELPKTRRCLPIAGNHVTNASKRTWVWVRQNPRCAEIFRSAWLTGPQLECQRCAPDFREEQCRSFRRSNHSPDARRLLARGQFHRPLLASINPARSI